MSSKIQEPSRKRSRPLGLYPEPTDNDPYEYELVTVPSGVSDHDLWFRFPKHVSLSLGDAVYVPDNSPLADNLPKTFLDRVAKLTADHKSACQRIASLVSKLLKHSTRAANGDPFPSLIPPDLNKFCIAAAADGDDDLVASTRARLEEAQATYVRECNEIVRVHYDAIIGQACSAVINLFDAWLLEVKADLSLAVENSLVMAAQLIAQCAVNVVAAVRRTTRDVMMTSIRALQFRDYEHSVKRAQVRAAKAANLDKVRQGDQPTIEHLIDAAVERKVAPTIAKLTSSAPKGSAPKGPSPRQGKAKVARQARARGRPKQPPKARASKTKPKKTTRSTRTRRGVRRN